MENSKKISMGVGISPLVVPSVKEAKPFEKVDLVLIDGLTPDGIKWRNMGDLDDPDVPTDSDSSVTFNKIGFYRPVILGYLQHESYGILIFE